MLILKKVAVTGGLSCGKSTVCKILQEKGAYVVDADAIVHKLLSPQSSVGKQLTTLFGEEAIRGDAFDRAFIAEKVFNNRETLKALESILHPKVIEEIEKQYNEVQDKKSYTLFVAEIPLLYEIDKANLFDKVIAVVANPQIAKKRFEQYKHRPSWEFEKRMTHQLPPQEKSARANYLITNNGDLADLKKQVEPIYQQLTQET